MKTCPCCKALTFDDMELCYGCMHPFKKTKPVIPIDMELSLDESVPQAVDEEMSSATALHIELPGYRPFDMAFTEDRSLISIGRAFDNDIIVEDPYVSRHHASVFLSEGNVWIRDDGSRNLTLVDGIPLVGTREIRSGAHIKIGIAFLTLR